MAELAVYNSQLSAAQVAAEYQASQYSTGLTPVQVVTVTDPGGHTLTYVMDPLNGNRMLTQTDGLGNTTQYGYDTRGFLYTTTDPDGNVTTTGHDLRGNLVSQTTCQDQATNTCTSAYYSYYPDDTTTELTPDPRNDMILTERGPGSASATDNTYLTTYTWNSSGNLTKQTGPDLPGAPGGYVTTTTYTTSSTAAVGGGTTPAGLPATVTSPGGAVTTTGYYSNGDVAQVTDPDGMITSYTYDGVGRLLTKTEVSNTYPNGLTTSYAYDQMGDVVTETDPPVQDQVTSDTHTAQTTTTYDPDGDVLTQTVADTTGGDASREVVNDTYNSYDQLTLSKDAAGNPTSYTYDAYGNLASQADAAGNTTTYAYDPNGNLLTTTLQNYTGSPPGSQSAAPLVEESRAYDPAARLASVTDSMGWITSYAYTDNGLTATVTRSDPHTGASFVQESDSYNAAGQLTQKVTSNGATTTDYTPDVLGRLTSQTLDPTALDRTTTNTYSPDDYLTSTTVTGPGSTTPAQAESYTYDPMGNLTSKTQYGGENLNGWWQLNQTSGTTVPDASGNGDNATATSVTWSGGAGVFNGTSSQVTAAGPALDTAGSYSVSAWVNLASTSATQGIVSQPASEQDGFRLQYDTSNKSWQFDACVSDPNPPSTCPSKDAASASTTPTTGTWYQVAGTYNATTGAMTLYVNGAQAGTGTDTTPFAATGPLTIGHDKWNGAAADYLHGSIADVQVYQHVLTPAQIAGSYQAGRNAIDNPANALTTTWTLDQRGLPTAMTDPNGNTTYYTYDQAGHLALTTDPAVSVQTYANQAPTQATPTSRTGYDTFGEPVETTDPNGNETITAYDADGRPVTVTQPTYTPPGGSPITAVTTTHYNNLGQVDWSTDPPDPGQIKTSYTYDQLGNVVSQTAPDGGVTTSSYDTDGDLLNTTGPTGAVTSATWDYLGRQLTSTQVDGPAYTTSNTYGTGGWLATSTTPDGVTTSYGYDAAGETTSITDGAGNVTSYGYDAAGRQTSTTSPDGTQSTQTFDEAGRMTGQADLSATGTVLRSSSASYDGDGNMLSSTDFNQHTTTFTYDPTGLVASETQPVAASKSITTSFGYDLAGNQTLYTDGNGSKWWTTYNSWNLPECQIEPPTAAYPNQPSTTNPCQTPSTATFASTYDADGNLATLTEPGGVTITNGYDPMGRLTSQTGTGADAATATRSFTYDTAGNMTSAATTAAGTQPATSEAFTYNDRGDVLTATGAAGSSSLAYNGDGQPTSVTDTAGTTSYTYDNAGRLSTLADPLTATTATYSYNQMSQVSQISYGTGNDVRTFGYNNLHQLTSDTLATANNQQVASISYGYDSNGNLTSKTTSGFAGSSSNTYTYDYANRLTSWASGTTTTNYAYDNDGNLTQAGNQTLTYDARDELLASSSSAGTTTYAWTARGTQASVSGPGGNTTTTSDAYGQAITQAGQTYTYDASGRLISSAGKDAFTLSYAGTTSQIASDGTWNYTYDPSGTLAAVGVSGGTTAQATLALTDNHTNVVGEFGPAGSSLAGSTSYDPYGNITAASGFAGTLGYQTDFTDPATSLVQMGARWYAPANGQFTSRDTTHVSPDPDPAGANPYAYAADNPLTMSDPTGHMYATDTGGGGCGTPAQCVARANKAAAASTTRYQPAYIPFNRWAAAYGAPHPRITKGNDGGHSRTTRPSQTVQDGSNLHLNLSWLHDSFWRNFNWGSLAGMNFADLGPLAAAVAHLPAVGYSHIPHVDYSKLPDTAGSPGLAIAERMSHVNFKLIRGLSNVPYCSGKRCFNVGGGETIWQVLGAVGGWAWNNRGTIASVLATGLCLVPAVGIAACAGLQVLAYSVRASQRIQTYGFSQSLDANLADGVMTAAFVLPALGATATGLRLAGLTAGGRMILKSVSTIPDFTQFIGGLAPGHDRVFFNGNTLNF